MLRGLPFATPGRKGSFLRLAVVTSPLILVIALLVWQLGPLPIPGKTRIVASDTSNPLLKVICTQQFTGTPEPYIVSLWYQQINQPWKWVYVDHEDSYWWRGTVKVASDGKAFFLKRGSQTVATANLPGDRYMLNGEITVLSERSRVLSGLPEGEW